MTPARPTIPRHVEYTLTPMGRDVASQLVALIEHLESLVSDVERARARYDRAKDAAEAASA